MAAPIKFEPIRRDAKEELIERLDRAPAEHAEALLAVWDLLQGLHDRGVIDALNGVLKSSDFILETAVETANTPENIRTIRNLMLLNNLLGSIDPDLLTRLAGAIPDGLAQLPAPEAKVPGLLSLLQKFNSPDSRRAMAFMASLLESIGKKLGEKKEP
jgi:uncharacterized protein YjgD (DUF1641 family)